MIRAENISLKIGQVPLLSKLNLNCAKGTVTALMGPNGAGKTSLLKVLSNDHRRYDGQVLLNGTPIKQWKPQDRAKMMAVLPQHSSLEFPFSVEEVVRLGRIPHDTGVNRDREIVNAALARVDASYLARRNYPDLSGGEKQRVQLARVLAQIWQQPIIDGDKQGRVLLLDEPSASFDLAHQQLLKDIVLDMACQGVVVVMVVHDFNLSASVSDQLAILNCGVIKAVGTPVEILQPELIKSVFDVQVDVIPHPSNGQPLVVC